MPTVKEFPTERYPDGVVLKEYDLRTTTPGPVPFKSSHFVVPPGTITEDDQHEVREIWYVAGGCGIVRIDGVAHAVESGQALLFEPQEVHNVQNSGDNDLTILSVWW